MDGVRHPPSPLLIMMIAFNVMFNTLRPILIPPTVLNASCPKPEMMTEAEFRVKQVAIKSFWMFSNSAFAFVLAAALVQVWSRTVHVSGYVADRMLRGERVLFTLVMVAMLCMSISGKCAMVVNLWPSWFLSATSLIEGLLLLLTLCLSMSSLVRSW